MTSSVRWVGLMFFACGGGNAIAPPTTVAVSVPEGVTRYIVGGDSRDDSAHVLPWAFREAKARGAHAFFFLGDMELTPWFDAHFRTELGSLDPIPFYPVLGNHEVRVLGAIDIGTHHAQNAFRKNFLGTPHTPVMSELTNRVVYSVNLPGHVHFVALDNVSQNGFGDEQLAWLDEDLRNARFDPNVRHIFVGMHKPLAHNGVSSHGMDADGDAALADSARALEMFQRAHVDLVLASHVHRFARFDQGGIRSYVTGGLGAPLTPSGPDTAFHHFLVIDVVGDEVKVEVVRFDGKPSLATDDIED